MKTHQPTDFDKTHQDERTLGQGETYMGRDEQVKSFRVGFAWFVLLGFGIWLSVWGATGLWEIFTGVAK